MGNKRIDEPTGTEFVGHEWDGIEELNTPLPRWWLWTFYATVIWGVAFMVLYPAWPMISQGTQGYLGWSSRGQYNEEVAVEELRRAPIMEALAATPLTELSSNPELLNQAIAGGASAFRVHCVQCHGANAAGSEGYPNLTDDEWLWGGDLESIEYTLLHGVRHPGDRMSRNSLMPAFGSTGMLDSDQLSLVTDHVLSLTDRAEGSAAGASLYAANCAVCHGANGEGLRQFGSPSLNDAVWLYGSSAEQIRAQIYEPSHGVMPAWNERLDEATIKMLAAYVHSLGGGENFAEAEPAEEPAVDEQD